MKTIEKWMKKNDICYTEKTFGNNYFYNASIAFEGVTVTLERGEVHVYEKIRKYAARYGYVITDLCGFPGCTYFNIMKAEDHAALQKIIEYAAKAQNACNDAIHMRREGFFSDYTDADFNEYLKGIMQMYEEEYMNAA